MRELGTRETRKSGPVLAPRIVRDVLASPGRALDGDTRAFFEPRFGHDFSRVRVHDGAQAMESARAVHASAYTVGQHIVMGTQDAPSSPVARGVFAHELGHALQQPAYHGAAELHIDDTYEHAADTAAQRALGASASAGSVSAPAAPNAHVARFRGPMPRPAPVRPRTHETIPSTRSPSDAPYQAPIVAPDPYDTSFQAMLDRASIRNAAERQRIAAERPVATLQRGGTEPDFITEHGTRRYSWIGGAGGGGSVDARVRRFHVLDAIEHDVGNITHEDQLQGVIARHFPDEAWLILLVGGTRRGLGLTTIPMLRLLEDEPVFSTSFDPQAQTRLQVLQAAVEARSATVPALARSRLTPRGRTRGGCRIEPIAPLGDDPLSSLYCHAATGSPYSYKITVLSPTTGGATRRWAEIDALRGNTWYECKCGYEALLSGEARGQGVARAKLDELTHQVLNHLHIARTCGLDYRYIVSSEEVAERLRDRWFGNVVIDVEPWDPCD